MNVFLLLRTFSDVRLDVLEECLRIIMNICKDFNNRACTLMLIKCRRNINHVSGISSVLLAYISVAIALSADYLRSGVECCRSNVDM